jgi:hypothetical protein
MCAGCLVSMTMLQVNSAVKQSIFGNESTCDLTSISTTTRRLVLPMRHRRTSEAGRTRVKWTYKLSCTGSLDGGAQWCDCMSEHTPFCSRPDSLWAQRLCGGFEFLFRVVTRSRGAHEPLNHPCCVFSTNYQCQGRVSGKPCRLEQ